MTESKRKLKGKEVVERCDERCNNEKEKKRMKNIYAICKDIYKDCRREGEVNQIKEAGRGKLVVVTFFLDTSRTNFHSILSSRTVQEMSLRGDIY